MLTRRVTEAEVRDALFMMHTEKAHGPDGMVALLFQRSWHIVKENIITMVNNFLTSGTFDERLNVTNICLMPKTKRLTKMTELRPISLCNVGYKIISKVLCQRLKVLLARLISETQSAFVPGRLISDNILIAQEMFHGLRTNKSCKGKFMAVKTDMSKAYDRVEWPFIEELMRKMGFAEQWITWMMWCITSVKYKEYEAASGQQINFAKSSIQFRHIVDAGVKAEIHHILGIEKIGGMGTYLVWDDPWIPASRPRSAKGNRINFYPYLWVRDLMTPGRPTLNLPLFNQLFDSRDVSLIMGIPTSHLDKPDYMGWFYTKTGRYTVKSGMYFCGRTLTQLRSTDRPTMYEMWHGCGND
ncbi:unnamed protein product [Microthlaspi erraticum]|uniref:Reverse transcriptase domain-containing protein n=1 Tax=Microthlaspi erraticum TaxID=1685480 RepID=A0A6D2JT50_9BRAS|nr:unnamed protein product [Microthlaspi erraticum]